MISFAPYARLLRERDLRFLFGASLIGRLPIGMTGLAILLLVQQAVGSFAAGGAVTGCYIAGLASVAPPIGRLIDRRGPRGVLLASALLFPASLWALVGAVYAGSGMLIVLLWASAAGAAFPPITVCIRTYLRQRLADDAHLSTAYSLDSALIELMFIAGPLLVAALVAFASPSAAVSFAAACGAIGALLFWRSKPLGSWRIEAARSATLLGPLATRNFVPLIAIVACYSLAFGLTEIGVVAFAAENRHPTLAGVFLGVMSAGSALGGLAYGSRSWGAPLLRQFGVTLAIMAIGLFVLAAPWSSLAFFALCFVAGIVMAPALIIQSMLIAKTARPEHTTEAFTWSTTALLAGVGLGMAAGGVLVESWQSPAALAAGGASTAFAAALAWWLADR